MRNQIKIVQSMVLGAVLCGAGWVTQTHAASPWGGGWSNPWSSPFGMNPMMGGMSSPFGYGMNPMSPWGMGGSPFGGSPFSSGFSSPFNMSMPFNGFNPSFGTGSFPNWGGSIPFNRGGNVMPYYGGNSYYAPNNNMRSPYYSPYGYGYYPY